MILQQWSNREVSEILESLHSGEHGLSKEEAESRLKEYGPNKLPEAKTDNFALIFLRQFQSPLIYILFAAALAVLWLGEAVDGAIIFAVLIFNAIVGSIQEGKAQNTLLALKKFVETNATVLRDQKEMVIPDGEVIPGDVIILQEGEKVPADSRIISVNNLKVDEAALTGESEPIHKTPETLHIKNPPIAEQKNMVFKGTTIVAGDGKAVAVATGLETAIGRVSKQVAAIDTEIPLKKNIRYLSRLIIITVASIGVALFFLGLFTEKSAKEMFATVVSLSVSIIPEGLPIVMTLVLATGVWRMSKRSALVKKLQAVEALGQARIIAVDKTGTITKNEMVIQSVYADKNFFEVGGIGYEPKGEMKFEGSVIDPLNHPELLFMGKTAAFCAKARLRFSDEDKQWRISGDPTEAALLVFAEKIGFHKDDLEKESPLSGEIPFDYKIKYHTTVHKIEDNKQILVAAGAPENILAVTKKIWHGGKNLPLLKKERDEIESIFFNMSGEGLRVVALAITYDVPKKLNPENLKELSFVGFFGMKDTLRPEVSEAMQKATSAGMRVIMVTGDHKVTAKVIAQEAGIYHEGDEILTGQEIDLLSEQELLEKLPGVSVFARVTPEHKLKIIEAYKQRGEIIAMTGDGVNDAPSLVAADLGVAMGKIGTEVAKEAADIVLLDDNFGSIVSAVEEGRSIYKTIKKVVLYLFSTSLGELLTIAGALFLGYPLPILPAQIIWLNFVTDGFLDVSLAMEPQEGDLLRQRFKRSKKYVVDKLMAQRMFLMAIPMALGALLVFKEYLVIDLVKAWTMTLTLLAAFQWFNAWNCRHESISIFKMNPFSNKFLAVSTIIVVVLQVFAVYNPVMQKLLHTTSLSLFEWLLIVLIAVSIIAVEEIRKLLYRKFSKAKI